ALPARRQPALGRVSGRSAPPAGRAAPGGCRPAPPKSRSRTHAAHVPPAKDADPFTEVFGDEGSLCDNGGTVTLPRRIVGLGGGGFSRFGRSSRLDDHVLSLTQKDHPRVLFLGTAGGDADSHIVLFYEAFSGRARPAHLKLFGAPSRMEWRPLIRDQRSEEHTSELQSRFDLVCRLLLEKKK